MPRPYLSRALRAKVAADAGERCGYCPTSQSFTAASMHVEHIIPISAGGSSHEENLWLACALCNGHKSSKSHAVDPVTGREVPLFNPRQQEWWEHFTWSETGTDVVGQTPIGRATVIAVQLNDERLVRARRRWIAVGWHPPSV